MKRNAKWATVASFALAGFLMAKPVYADPGDEYDLQVNLPGVEVGIQTPLDPPEGEEPPVVEPPDVEPPVLDPPVDPEDPLNPDPNDPGDLEPGPTPDPEPNPEPNPGPEPDPEPEQPEVPGIPDDDIPQEEPPALPGEQPAYEGTPVHQPEVAKGKQDFAFSKHSEKGDSKKEGGKMPDTSSDEPLMTLMGLLSIAVGGCLLFVRRLLTGQSS